MGSTFKHLKNHIYIWPQSITKNFVTDIQTNGTQLSTGIVCWKIVYLDLVIKKRSLRQTTVELMAVQYSEFECSTFQCSAGNCSAVQCSVVQFNTEQFSAVVCNLVKFSAL